MIQSSVCTSILLEPVARGLSRWAGAAIVVAVVAATTLGSNQALACVQIRSFPSLLWLTETVSLMTKPAPRLHGAHSAATDRVTRVEVVVFIRGCKPKPPVFR